MEFYTELSRKIPVEGEYDVIVAGSGPSGPCAAIMSGRNGAKVLLIEWNNSVGGMSTSGLMSHWTGSVSSPLYTEILNRCASYCEGEDNSVIVPWIDPEILKTVWLDMLREAGVTVLLYTFVCDAVMEGNRVAGVVTCNMTNCTDVDGTKAENLTRAEIICRSQMPAIVSYLREYVPGFEHCYIISSGSMMGIRETRHFKGEQTLNENDILTARYFDDWVVRGAHFNFDVHNLTGSGLDPTGVQHEWKQPEGYTIPYGCLIPKDIEGLLLSGRNISGTHLAHSNFRVMPICAGIGAAAGAAAALAVKRGIGLREVNIRELQKLL